MKGQSISPGIAIGKALLVSEEEPIIPHYLSTFELEEARLGQAIGKCRNELAVLKEKTRLNLGEEMAQVFEAQIKCLQDPELLKKTLKKVRAESVNAEYALAAIYHQEKDADIHDVTERLLSALLKKQKNSLENLSGPFILVAREFTASKTAALDRKKVLGLLSDNEGKNSLAKNFARALKIPAIFGLHQVTAAIKNGDVVALDGETGEVVINPSEEELEHFKKKKRNSSFI